MRTKKLRNQSVLSPGGFMRTKEVWNQSVLSSWRVHADKKDVEPERFVLMEGSCGQKDVERETICPH